MSAFTSFSGKTRSVVNDDVVRAASPTEIPIISLELPQPELIEKLRDACTRVGFFYIKDHGVPQDVIDATFKTAKDFFALDRETKDEIHYKKSKILRGYEPLADISTYGSKKADQNEAFSWGYETELDPLATESSAQDEVPSPMSGPNVWPRVPTFKPTIAAYNVQLLTLGRRLIRLFALALGVEETHFDHMFTHPGAIGRLIHYPPQSPTATGSAGIGAHTDFECFTILCQGAQPALQILNSEGEWLLAPPINGTFVVNIGDMLSYWSNDAFKSTVHRVLNITGEERYSIPFFVGPNYESLIEPLEHCVKAGQKNYDSINAGDYVWRRLARNRFSDEEYNKMFPKQGIAA